MTSFRGWIPTITGKLSFTQIGLAKDSKPDPNVINTLMTDGALLAYQERITRDRPIHPFIQKWLMNRSTKQIFIIQACSCPGELLTGIVEKSGKPKWTDDAKAVLKGKIFVYIEPPKWRFKWLNKKKSQFTCEENLQQLRSEMAYVRGKWEDEKIFVERELTAELQNSASADDRFYKLNFSLNRNGLCTLHTEDVGILENSSDSEYIHKFAKQAFFCLRDLIHHHYHHDANQELIGLCYPLKKDNKFDDKTWRRETLYGLTRMALQARRNRRTKDSKNALGVLAYAKSFQEHFSKWDFNSLNAGTSAKAVTTVNQEFSAYDFDSMNTSLKADISLQEWKRSSTLSFVAAILATSALVFSTIIGAHIVLSNSDGFRISESFSDILNLLIDHSTVLAFFIPFLISLIIYFLVSEAPFSATRRLGSHRFQNALLLDVYNMSSRPALSWGIVIILGLLFSGFTMFVAVKLLGLAWNLLL